MASVIAGVQETLEAYLNRPVEPVQIREVAVANFQGVLYLSASPVWEVISCGTTVDTAPLTRTITPVQERSPLLQEDGRLIDKWPTAAGSFYRLVPGGLNVGMPGYAFYVEYIGGYKGYLDEALKLAIKRVAAREWASNHIGGSGNRVGQAEQTEVGDARFLGWSADELKMMQRLRRRLVVR